MNFKDVKEGQRVAINFGEGLGKEIGFVESTCRDLETVNIRGFNDLRWRVRAEYIEPA